jgi:parvulin-like peptidyl-prolyl isomerase
LPVAIVDGQYITVLESYRQIGYIEHFSQKTNQNVGTPDEMRQKVNDRLIEKAMVTKIAKQTRLRVSEKEITEALEKVYQDNGGEKPVAEVLQSLYGMTIPEFKKLIREQLIKQKVKEHALTRVQVRHIVIRDESKAKEVLEKVKNNENFDELAKQFSEDIGSRDKGGQLGFVNRGQLPKEVEDVAFTKKAGETHPDLVKSQFGFHIVRVEARNEGTIDLTYDDLIKQFKEKKRIIRFLK